MADDKSKIGGQDRERVAAEQDYEVQYLAERTGITTDEARKLIKEIGNNRDKLERAARELQH